MRWASWQASERVARRSKVIPFQGTRIILRPHDPVSSSVLYYGLPDFKEMRFLLAWLSPGDVFIDVGANVGLYSVLAAGVRRASVAAFEPSSETSERLLENIRLNQLDELVAVETAAVGAEDGRARLSVRFGPMNRLVGDAHEVASEEVRVIQLDGWWSACGEPTVSLLKIDVEGQELDVLAGSLRLLSSQRPALIVEVNDPHGLSRFVREHGYTHVAFDERTQVVESSPLTCRVGGNAIFVANLDEARERLLRSARPAAGDG